MGVMMMVMSVVMTMSMTMRVTMGTMIMTTTVSAMWFKYACYGVKHIVTTDASPTAMAECYQIDDVANEGDEGCDNHGRSIEFKATMVEDCIYSRGGLNNKPEHKYPNHDNASQRSQNLRPMKTV